MFNVCHACGLYRADKCIEAVGEPGLADAICPECGHRHRFRRLPLLVLSGASGAGKSTVCQQLTGVLTQVVMLDTDILWRAEFDQPQTNYRDFLDMWLRLAKNIGQAGRPVMLVGAGVGVPHNLAPCVEHRYFSAARTLALVCDDDVLADRLRQRPAWRTSGGDSYVANHQQFNRWFQTQAPTQTPLIDLLDTTTLCVADTVARVAAWIDAALDQHCDEKP